MTERERETFMAWIIAEDFRLEDECQELQARMRTRKIGIEDCVEMALALQRREAFQTFALVALRILHLVN